MNTFSNDADFRQTLENLPPEEQRQVAVQFVKHVLALTDDPRLERILKVASDGEATEEDLANALRSARSAVLDSHTRCGAEVDWAAQAGYFVARAAEAALGGGIKRSAVGWATAMSSRMARTCESIDASTDAAGKETEAQYAILAEHLN